MRFYNLKNKQTMSICLLLGSMALTLSACSGGQPGNHPPPKSHYSLHTDGSVEHATPNSSQSFSVNIDSQSSLLSANADPYTYHVTVEDNNKDDGLDFQTQQFNLTTSGESHNVQFTVGAHPKFQQDSLTIHATPEGDAPTIADITETVTVEPENKPSIEAKVSANPIAKGATDNITYTGHNLTKDVDITAKTTDPSVTFAPGQCTLQQGATSDCTLHITTKKEDTNSSFEITSTAADNQLSITPVTVHFSQQPPASSNWPKNAIVGYLDGWTPSDGTEKATSLDVINQAMEHGYNVFVYAFGTQDSNATCRLDPTTWKITTQDLTQQINAIHNEKGLALLSFGGPINTFNPQLATTSKQNSAGKNMADFLSQHNFDGIDLDLENVNSSINDNSLIGYIDALRAQYKVDIPNKHLFITIAPQVAGYVDKSDKPHPPAYFSPKSVYTQNLLDNVPFDAVLLQTYNQNGGAQFYDHDPVSFREVQGSYDDKTEKTHGRWADPDFLPVSFEIYTTDEFHDSDIHLPKNTKLVIGVPDYMDLKYLEDNGQDKCVKNGKCAGIGVSDPQQIMTALTQPYFDTVHQEQYGGLMTWNLNFDAQNNWAWVIGIEKDLKHANQTG